MASQAVVEVRQAGGEMQGFAERLNQIIGGNRRIAAFARASGVHEANLRKYLHGSVPGMDKAVQIARAGGVTLEWLATGHHGSQALDDNHTGSYGRTQRRDARGTEAESLPQESSAADLLVLPQLCMKRSATHATVDQEGPPPDFIAFGGEFLRSAGIDPAHAAMVRVEGRSMMPSLVDGEWVVVDRSNVSIVDHAIYVVIYCDCLIIRRLRNEANGSVTMLSDNKSEGYGDRLVDKEERVQLTIVGRVRQHIRYT